MTQDAPPTPPSDFPARTVTCPACGGPSLYAPANPYRPFCGERCKQHDLGAWASESFRVPTSPPLEPAPGDGWPH
jgi:uncharacterized protein